MTTTPSDNLLRLGLNVAFAVGFVCLVVVFFLGLLASIFAPTPGDMPATAYFPIVWPLFIAVTGLLLGRGWLWLRDRLDRRGE